MAKLNRNVTVNRVTYGPDYPNNEVTAEVLAALKGHPALSGEVEAEPDETTSYEAMTHDALQEEIRRRNESGADLRVSGSKAELVKRLQEHDG